MLKDNERLQVEPVPVFNADEMVLSDYIQQLFMYCVELHNDIKDFGFNDKTSKSLNFLICWFLKECFFLVLCFVYQLFVG